jgi:V8-like Glu-specific endopeptidase
MEESTLATTDEPVPTIFPMSFYNGSCTGTLISKEGHILTARHCVDSSIELLQLSGKEEAPEIITAPDFFLFEKQHKDIHVQTYNLHNITEHLGVPVIVNRTHYYSKIIALGPGTLSPRFSSSLEDPKSDSFRMHSTYSDQGYSSGGDFAIIQIPEFKGRSCYRMTTKEVTSNAKLHSIAYPCLKEDGKDWPQRRKTKKNTFFPKGKLYETLYIPQGSIISELNMEVCNSGSSLFNEANEIVGVIHSGYLEDTDNTSRAMSISVNRIYELLPPKIRREIKDFNSHCNL